MSCEECRELSTHTFRSPDDLIHALRLAAEEMNRGVLSRVESTASPGTAEREALESALASGASPDMVRYRFRCEVCGDHFSLTGDTSQGHGGWTREERDDPLPRLAGIAVLRRLEVSDLAVFQAYRHDPRITRYQDWYGARTDAEASAFLAKMNARELLQPGICSQIGIAEADTLALVGDIGLTLAADGESAEIGYSIRPESQGRGMGTAAVREVINLVFERTNAERVLGIVDPVNVRSIRLLERVGMRMVESRSGTFGDAPCIDHVYAISRELTPIRLKARSSRSEPRG